MATVEDLEASHETTELAEVVVRVARDTGCTSAEVALVVDEEVRLFDDPQIRRCVPVIVERRVRERLAAGSGGNVGA